MIMVGMIGNTREDVDDSVELHVHVGYQHPFSSQARAWLHL